MADVFGRRDRYHLFVEASLVGNPAEFGEMIGPRRHTVFFEAGPSNDDGARYRSLAFSPERWEGTREELIRRFADNLDRCIAAVARPTDPGPVPPAEAAGVANGQMNLWCQVNESGERRPPVLYVDGKEGDLRGVSEITFKINADTLVPTMTLTRALTGTVDVACGRGAELKVEDARDVKEAAPPPDRFRRMVDRMCRTRRRPDPGVAAAGAAAEAAVAEFVDEVVRKAEAAVGAEAAVKEPALPGGETVSVVDRVAVDREPPLSPYLKEMVRVPFVGEKDGPPAAGRGRVRVDEEGLPHRKILPQPDTLAVSPGARLGALAILDAAAEKRYVFQVWYRPPGGAAEWRRAGDGVTARAYGPDQRLDAADDAVTAVWLFDKKFTPRDWPAPVPAAGGRPVPPRAFWCEWAQADPGRPFERYVVILAPQGERLPDLCEADPSIRAAAIAPRPLPHRFRYALWRYGTVGGEPGWRLEARGDSGIFHAPAEAIALAARHHGFDARQFPVVARPEGLAVPDGAGWAEFTEATGARHLIVVGPDSANLPLPSELVPPEAQA